MSRQVTEKDVIAFLSRVRCSSLWEVEQEIARLRDKILTMPAVCDEDTPRSRIAPEEKATLDEEWNAAIRAAADFCSDKGCGYAVNARCIFGLLRVPQSDEAPK